LDKEFSIGSLLFAVALIEKQTAIGLCHQGKGENRTVLVA